MMSPKVLEADGMIFWLHSYDAIHESRASVHVGKATQDDVSMMQRSGWSLKSKWDVKGAV